MMSQMTPASITELVFRRRKPFVRFFVAVILLYLIAMILTPSKYESDASVFAKIAEQDVATPNLVQQQQATGGGPLSTMGESLLNSVLLVFKSEDVMRAALDRIGIERVYPGPSGFVGKIIASVVGAGKSVIEIFTGPEKQTKMDRAVRKLVKDLDVKVTANTNVILVSVLNKDRMIAQELLSAIINAAIDRQAAVLHQPRIAFLEEKLSSLRSESDQALKNLQDFKTQTGIISLDDERTLLLAQRDTTQAALNLAQSSLSEAQSRLQSLQFQIEKIPSNVTLTDENDKTGLQINDAQSRLASAEADYNAAKLRFADGNPQLLDSEAQLEVARNNRARLNKESASRLRTGANPVYQQALTDKTTTTASINGFQATMNARNKQLDEINERLAFLGKNESQMRELEHRRDAADEGFRNYLERVNSAHIVSDMNQAGITSLSVVQTPTLPYETTQPRTLLLLAMSIFAGLAGGLALCIGLEALSSSMATPDQVESSTGLPLLAVVPYRQPR